MEEIVRGRMCSGHAGVLQGNDNSIERSRENMLLHVGAVKTQIPTK